MKAVHCLCRGSASCLGTGSGGASGSGSCPGEYSPLLTNRGAVGLEMEQNEGSSLFVLGQWELPWHKLRCSASCPPLPSNRGAVGLEMEENEGRSPLSVLGQCELPCHKLRRSASSPGEYPPLLTGRQSEYFPMA